jgi:hypothetical protein
MTWRVFYSYSHDDAELRDRLATHLAPLKHRKQIAEWHDREIAPGADWNAEISAQLESADLIVLLLSADFLASDYCFGVEVNRALARLKAGEVRVAPIIVKPCYWEESVFSELQILPRDAKPVSSYASPDEAWTEITKEIHQMTAGPAPRATAPAPAPAAAPGAGPGPEPAPDIVREQVRQYARLYERIRQRMSAGPERTTRMEDVSVRLRKLAPAYAPMLAELVASPLPGERLAAVTLLQRVALEEHLPFLVKTLASDKPFVGYHAARALEFAVGSLEPRSYPLLDCALQEALHALEVAGVGPDSDRGRILREAKESLQHMILTLAEPTARS